MSGGQIRNFVLMFADAVCIASCWAVTVLVYFAFGGRYDPVIYLRFWPVIPAFVAFNALFRLYHGRLLYPAVPFSPVEEMRRLVGSAFLLHVGVLAVLVLLRQTTEGFSRAVIVIAGVLTAVGAQPVRNVSRAILSHLGFGRIPVAIVGSGRTAKRLVEALTRDAYAGLVPVGCFSNEQLPIGDVPCWGGTCAVVEECRKHDVKILFACEDERLFRCQLRDFTEWFTYIEYFPTAEVFPVFGSRAVSVDGIGGLEMVNQDRMRELRLEKWVVDKLLSVLAFIALLPLLIVIGLLVRLTSSGPVLFRHGRLGRYGRPIKILKFRTMYADADSRLERILAEDPEAAEEWRRSFKLKNDPRVTPLGRFLRKTSLDELPQIFNVLGGSLALVGPRPIVEDEVRYYGSAYRIMSSVRPGVTGLWQVSGRSDTDYARRVTLDTYYVLNWSPWMDIWILVRTAFAVLRMHGAR